MKRWLVAGFLAVALVGIGHGKVSAICFDVYRPCLSAPIPRIPIFLPKFTFYCEPCDMCGCGRGLYGMGGPWYNQFPSGPASGYQIGMYGAFRSPTDFGMAGGYGVAPQSMGTGYPVGGYGIAAYGYGGGYGAPAYWYGR